jgi:hypothetical protein
MKLHLYILPSKGDGNPEGARRAEESFNHPAFDLMVTKISGPQLYLVVAHYATWFGYIYDDEIISRELRDALPTLLNHEQNNFYVFFKKDGEGESMKVFKSPRVFRNHVQLQKGLLVPVNPLLRNRYILDGWIKSQ